MQLRAENALLLAENKKLRAAADDALAEILQKATRSPISLARLCSQKHCGDQPLHTRHLRPRCRLQPARDGPACHLCGLLIRPGARRLPWLRACRGCHRSAAPPTGHPTACHGWRKWWKRRRRRRRRGRRCMVTKAKKRMVRIHLRCKSSPLDSHRSRHLAAEQWQPVTN